MFGRFSTDDRATMMFAAQEAAELGHSRVGADHVILGMLGNARSPMFALLNAQGLTLAAARESVGTFHADRAAAVADVDEDGDAQSRYDEDRDALRGLGIDLDRLRDAVRGRFGDDLAEGWGRRRERRGHGESRGDDRRDGDCGRRPHGEWPDRGEYRRGESGCEPRRDGGREGYGPGSREGRGPWETRRGRRGPRGRGMRPRFAPELREAFGNAVAFARTSEGTIRAEHLLIGILDLNSPAVAAAISHVVEPAQLRAAIVAALAEADAPA